MGESLSNVSRAINYEQVEREQSGTMVWSSQRLWRVILYRPR